MASASSSAAAGSRKRPSDSFESTAKKVVQEVAPAATGPLAVASVRALLGAFEDRPETISAHYMLELRAMGAAWTQVIGCCDRLERAQWASAGAHTSFGHGEPLCGVFCDGHFYLGGSDDVLGTPLSLDIWAMILELLEPADRLSFSRASKACLSLHRSSVTRLTFGYATHTNIKPLLYAREATEKIGGSLARARELERLLKTPRCREIVVGRAQIGDGLPGELSPLYCLRVVERAFERCSGKVALSMSDLCSDSQLGFLQKLYWALPVGGLGLSVSRLSCVMVHSRKDLIAVLKLMCRAHTVNSVTSRAFQWPPIHFESSRETPHCRPVVWNEERLSKMYWAFNGDTTRCMAAGFRGIFVASREHFEAFFPPACTGTQPVDVSNRELSPLFTVAFPVYIDPKATAANTEHWSRAERYFPAYFKKDEAAGLIDRLISEKKALTF